MKNIKLTNKEIEYLRHALQFYCDETTHERKDLLKVDGIIDCAPGLNPYLEESKILNNIREKLK